MIFVTENNAFFNLLDPLHRSQHESCSIVWACNGHTVL